MSARIAENGVRTKKDMAKTRFQELICEETELPRAKLEETEDLNIIKP